MKKRHFNLIILAIIFLAFSSGFFLVWQKERTFEIGRDQEAINQENGLAQVGSKSPLSALACENAQRRPVAIMLSSDAVARPLSGIGEADLVFEMPVTEGSITRLMAVFVCGEPSELGSVRSARHDFIPLALGVDAIYVHWGGSHFALDKLKTGIIDNLNALSDPFNVFYRKSGIEAPHNGFTSMKRILNAAEKLEYRLTSEFSGYRHVSEQDLPRSHEEKILRIAYLGQFRVGYEYNPETNSYFRFRGGLQEIDKNTGQQVEAKNVVVMRAESWPLEGQYNEVQVEGEGKAEFYLNGQAFQGSWKKDKNNQKSKLFFYDENGEEVKFVPGQIWVEIAQPEVAVTWE